jgi:hypothetical protein
MIVKLNQTAIDVAFDLSGSLAGLPTLLAQLPVGTRIGLDTYPTLDDVADIGQTWTPNIEGLTLDLDLRVYKDVALIKAPYGTYIEGLQNAITWGENLLPDLFDQTGYVEYEYLPNVVPDYLKHEVTINQTVVDVTFDLAGSLAGLPIVLSQLPISTRIGFDSLPQIYTDVSAIDQTWTPELQQQKIKFDVRVFNSLATKKRRFGTDILSLLPAITWGNEFLYDDNFVGDYLADDFGDFLTDDNINYVTT